MIRVFPRRTKWTPNDELAFVGDPPLFRPPEQEVRISVTFTWDIKEARRLGKAWLDYYSRVFIGGPAFNDPGGEFEPSQFIKQGVTITSRGCPRKCPWCFVPEREGKIRELAIKDGWIIQDNNLLACSKDHVCRVFEMLLRQPKPIKFAGGLDPRFFKRWHLDLFKTIKIDEMWFSSDYPKSYYHLEKVADLISDYPENKRRCYVLIGWNGDTYLDAEKRLEKVYKLGFLPFAQLFQGSWKENYPLIWTRLQRKWCRPAAYRNTTVNSPAIEKGR